MSTDTPVVVHRSYDSDTKVLTVVFRQWDDRSGNEINTHVYHDFAPEEYEEWRDNGFRNGYFISSIMPKPHEEFDGDIRQK
ncbi:hypothetical protein SAMN04488503_2010 [Humidesulfovibrio mexicanus]|uniref:KTSC domain-containing protein n=1 Tax=Humidesulfovibrio mexicanus TaxID=147047 RepID=A0A239AJG5_9BACT|nr:hypothetical protein [Humidesulfovibrio mexicanus]SNR95482.1 hypothetical protein SAMN04488503_2010 [Humidesulfovibrio mexicanus]